MEHPAFRGQVYVHVLPANRTLRDGRIPEIGQELKASIKYANKWGLSPNSVRATENYTVPQPCSFGMHAHNDPNTWYWWHRSVPQRGRWICIVRLFGGVRQESQKAVGLRRKIIAMRQMPLNMIWKKKLVDPMAAIDWVLEKPHNGIVIGRQG